MKIYQIDYALRKQRNYDDLYARIKSYGSCCRPLKSAWLVETSQSAQQVRDYLLRAMDKDDGLLVTRLATEAAWHDISDYDAEWLRQAMTQSV